MADETTSCNNYLATDGLIKNRNDASGQELLRHNKFSHWAPSDGKLHKGFNFGDASYAFGKRDVSNISNPFGKRDTYNGMPYSIYQATPGYQYKKGISYTINDLNIPDGLNWFMDPVSLGRDQMRCGNCWAFAAVASIEGAIWKKYNKEVHLSVQQLTDCSSDIIYGNKGCDGGNVW